MQFKAPGMIVDEMFENSRRLWIAHALLGLACAFVYWVRPGTFTPHLHTAHRGDGFLVILKTLVAWVPYIISGIFSRAVLSTRNSRATLLFIAIATGVSVCAASICLNLFGMQEPPPPFLVSIGVTVVLVSVAGLFSVIWRSDAPEQ
jgi:hypothetical protein